MRKIFNGIQDHARTVKTPAMIRLIVSTAALTLAMGSSAVQAQQFTFTDLGTLGSGAGLYSRASAINDAGQIVGITGSNAGWHATIWNQGVATILDPTNYSTATAINNLGQVVGMVGDDTGRSQATLWSNGTKTNLGASFGSVTTYATGINDAGQIVGTSLQAGVGTHALVWQGGQLIDLGSGSASGNNNLGQVVGATGGYATSPVPTLWNGTTATSLPMGDLYAGSAVSINNSGQITGWGSWMTGEHDGQVILWNDSSAIPSGLTKGYPTGSSDNNDAGQVVGTLDVPSSQQYMHAALWGADGAVIDLNDLLDPTAKGPTGWILQNAFSINNQGWIVGSAYNPYSKVEHGFVYAPTDAYAANPFLAISVPSIPEPQTCMLMMLGLISVAGVKTRRHRKQ